MSTFGERLARAVELSPLDQKTAAERLGVTEGQLSKWVHGKFPPQGRYMLQLPALLGIDGHWLLTGEGDPVPLPPGEAAVRLQEIRAIVLREATAPVEGEPAASGTLAALEGSKSAPPTSEEAGGAPLPDKQVREG
jgi:transcriptional regulator with XRE-family HTH domain